MVSRTPFLAKHRPCFDGSTELAYEPNHKAAQTRCILTMILRLRMFCSHPLTVQDLLKYLLRPMGSLMGNLTELSQGEASINEDASREIVSWIFKVKNNYNQLVEQRREEEMQPPGRSNIFSFNLTLAQKYRQHTEGLSSDKQHFEYADRMLCPNCGLAPDKKVVTSCLHAYCEGCYTGICMDAEDASRSETKPICRKCTTQIEEVTRYTDTMETVLKPAGGTGQRGKRRQPAIEKGKAKKKGSSKLTQAGNCEPEDDEDEHNWIRACGAKMPNVKLTGIRNTIRQWKTSDKDTKVVIFSQFTDFIDILAAMCKEECWGFRCVSIWIN